MKERTFTMQYKEPKVYKDVLYPGEIVNSPPRYKIDLTYNNKIMEVNGKNFPMSKRMMVIAKYKLSEEQEKEVIKILEATPLNTSIEKLIGIASKAIVEVWEKSI